MMKKLTLNLPDNAQVTGALYDTLHPDYLVQDMLFIRINDIVIDVGWLPEHDPSGCFWISAFRGQWEKQLIGPIRVCEPGEVKAEVERLAAHFRDPATVKPEKL